MVQKVVKIGIKTILFGLLINTIIYNIEIFTSTTERFFEIFDLDNLKNWFEVYNSNSNVIYEESLQEIEDAVGDVVENINSSLNKPWEEIMLDILTKVLDFGFTFIIYFCNYGLNALLLAFIFFHESLSGVQEKVKTTTVSGLYISLLKCIDTIKKIVLTILRWLKSKLYDARRVIALLVLAFLSSNGFLYRLFVEVIIFLITYIIRMINLETYILVFGIFQSLFTLCYPKLKYVPTYIWIPIIILAFFFKAISRAEYKLKKNHDRLKSFANDKLTQTTFINGAPGTGKTLLNVSLSLVSEENYINELEKQLLDYEMKYKFLNFADVRVNQKDYPEHSEYINTYNLLNNRGTFLISNYSIFSPYYNEYSKIFNFDYMRVNRKTDIYPLDEYIVISLSEFDKEYNSHDNKKEVGEDGAATFFSTVSHSLKRHTKIFVDYQLKDQVPLRIRGNSEYFITIKDRKKKYPFLLSIYYLPIKALYSIVRNLIKKYEMKKNTINKKSKRKTVAKYKRNDITLLYAVLRHMAYSLNKLCTWFDHYYFFLFSTDVSQEDSIVGIKKKLFINICDLSYENKALYDSTFLSYSYEEKKNYEFKDLDRFTSLRPTIEELNKCNSRFYNKINQ